VAQFLGRTEAEIQTNCEGGTRPSTIAENKIYFQSGTSFQNLDHLYKYASDFFTKRGRIKNSFQPQDLLEPGIISSLDDSMVKNDEESP
jgi:hypothetical protein